MSTRRRRSRARSGAASVEAVLVMPVLAIALLCLMFLQTRAHARDQARALARRCALQYAMNGCQRVPSGCVGVVGPLELDGGGRESQRLRQGTAAGDSFGVLDLPLIGDAVDALFGRATRARVDRELAQPWRSTPAHIGSEFVVLCNDHPRDVRGAIARVFCDLLPLVQCGDGR